eukprot:scaffold6274_cov132-Isochrysis_galbana.AAC.7
MAAHFLRLESDENIRAPRQRADFRDTARLALAGAIPPLFAATSETRDDGVPAMNPASTVQRPVVASRHHVLEDGMAAADLVQGLVKRLSGDPAWGKDPHPIPCSGALDPHSRLVRRVPARPATGCPAQLRVHGRKIVVRDRARRVDGDHHVVADRREARRRIVQIHGDVERPADAADVEQVSADGRPFALELPAGNVGAEDVPGVSHTPAQLVNDPGAVVT